MTEGTTRDVATRAGTIRVELRGGGPEVLLLHGLSANRHTWEPVALRLEAHFRLCVPDLPGRGESEPRPDQACGLADELQRLRELLESMPFRPRIVAGHSQGAVLAAALAASDSRIEGLVLVNPVTPWTRRPVALSLLRSPLVREFAARTIRPLRRPLAGCILRRVYGPGRRPTTADVRRYAAPYAELDRARCVLRALAEWEPAALQTLLPQRSLAGWVLATTHDRRIRLRDAARLAGSLGLEFAAPRGAGHVLPEEEPETVVRAVFDVLAAIDAGGHWGDSLRGTDGRVTS